MVLARSSGATAITTWVAIEPNKVDEPSIGFLSTSTITARITWGVVILATAPSFHKGVKTWVSKVERDENA